MRILFLAQVLPFPLDAGPKVRAHYVIRHLAAAGHEVHLLSFSRPNDSPDALGALGTICTSVHTVPMVRSRIRDVRDGLRSLATDTPFLLLRDQVAAMQTRVGELLQERSFDAIHVDQLWMAPYALGDHAPRLTVLDQHNAVFMIPRRLAERQRNPVARALLRNEARKLHAFERTACHRFGRVVWVTEEDRQAVLAETANGHDSVIPIAIDTRDRAPIRRERPFRVTFLGGMHWPPNMEGVAWFAEAAWPRVSRAIPSAVLTIIGQQGRSGAQRLESAGRVEVTGYVSDPSRYLAETAVFIVPLRVGAGMRVKILDAWSWGLPIVSTTIGAEGLKAADNANALIADDADAFADAVVRAMTDKRLAARLVDGGRATVEAHYDWRQIYHAWDRVYQS